MPVEPPAATRRSIFLILNDRAEQSEPLGTLLAGWRQSGYRVEEHPVGRDGPPAELAVRAAREGFDAVVAAGGDGTLNEVVTGVVRSGRTDLAIGLLPFGTANDFATACGHLSYGLEEQVYWTFKAAATPVDVGKVNDRYFINVASGGFGAEASAETPQYLKGLLGGLAYSITGLVKVFEGKARKGVFQAPDFAWEGDILLFAVSNGRQAGGGYIVAPAATLNDRLLDVLIVPDPGLLDLPAALEDMFRPGTFDTNYVKHFQAPWLRVEAPADLHVNVDGEPMQADSFRFGLHGQQLPMLLPPEAPVRDPAGPRRLGL